MKKLFAILLAVAMIAAMSVTAFAAVVTDFTDDTEINVLGTYNDQYVQKNNVELSWGAMAFTYNTQAATWDESTHLWETSGTEGWTCADGANEIKLKNHSSQDVVASFSYAAVGASGISGSFTTEETAWEDDNLTMAVEVNPDADATEAYEAHEYVVALTLSGELASTWTAGTAVGTITIGLR